MSKPNRQERVADRTKSFLNLIPDLKVASSHAEEKLSAYPKDVSDAFSADLGQSDSFANLSAPGILSASTGHVGQDRTKSPVIEAFSQLRNLQGGASAQASVVTIGCPDGQDNLVPESSETSDKNGLAGTSLLPVTVLLQELTQKLKGQADEQQERRRHDQDVRTNAFRAELGKVVSLPPPTVKVETPAVVKQTPTAADLIVSATVKLTPGAQTVYKALHALAEQLSNQEVERLAEQGAETASTPQGARFRRAAIRNGTKTCPSYVFHCPQALLAEMTGYSVRHQARLLQELIEANLVMTGGQSEPMPVAWMYRDLTAEQVAVLKAEGKVPGMYTGTLFRVRLSFEGHPKLFLTRADYGVRHRDLEADTMRGRTPLLWMSELQTLLSGQQPSIIQMTDAVIAFISNLPLSVVRTCTFTDLQNIIYTVHTLGERRGAWQALAVDCVAAGLSSCFNDLGWKAWWCKQLWTAICLDTLEALASRLQRLLHDAREWPGVQNLGALFAARQKAS